MRIFHSILLCFCVMLTFAHTPVRAQDDETESSFEAEESSIYELLTMDKLSQLYWGIGKLNIKNDTHIDNFMLINQCGIYDEYIHNEFEWGDIREAARAYIDANIPYFPLRFEIMQPIRLGEYNIDEEAFDVHEDDRIDAMRRFHVAALDSKEGICGTGTQIAGYPKAVVIEFSRPFNFVTFPLSKEKAKKLVAQKLKSQMEAGGKAHLSKTRNIYLVFKFKVFAYKGELTDALGRTMAHVLAVLESIEVYGDSAKKDLLFESQFRTRSNRDYKESGDEGMGVDGFLGKEEPESAPVKKRGGALSLDNEDY